MKNDLILKKINFIILIILLVVFSNLVSGQEVNTKQEDSKINMQVIDDNYFEPLFLGSINSKVKDDFSFAKIKPNRKLNVEIITDDNKIMDFINREKIGFVKFDYMKSFVPLKVLLEVMARIKPGDKISVDSTDCEVGKKIKVKLIFKASDNITPDKDFASYVKVFVDKRYIATTQQKLLSQEKTINFETTCESHLLKMVVYIQDPYKKRWRRLRNIEQPPQKYFVSTLKYVHSDDKVVYLRVIYSPTEKMDKYNFEGSFDQSK